MTNRELVFSVVTSLGLLALSLVGQKIGYDSHGFSLVAAGLLVLSFGNKIKSKWHGRSQNHSTLSTSNPVGEK